VDDDQTLKVLIAAGEALANAIEHGHRHHTDGTISLRATALADRLRVTVIDAGSWKPPVAAAHRGRGISLMRAADLGEQAARAMLADLAEWRLVNQQHDLSITS